MKEHCLFAAVMKIQAEKLERENPNSLSLSLFLESINYYYVMLCYVMLCYVMLCYVMLCYVMLC